MNHSVAITDDDGKPAFWAAAGKIVIGLQISLYLLAFLLRVVGVIDWDRVVSIILGTTMIGLGAKQIIIWKREPVSTARSRTHAEF